MSDGPHVDHSSCVGRDEHSVAELDIGGGKAGPGEEWARWVDPQRLLHNGLEVREVSHISVCNCSMLTYDSVQLGLEFGLDARVED